MPRRFDIHHSWPPRRLGSMTSGDGNMRPRITRGSFFPQVDHLSPVAFCSSQRPDHESEERRAEASYTKHDSDPSLTMSATPASPTANMGECPFLLPRSRFQPSQRHQSEISLMDVQYASAHRQSFASSTTTRERETKPSASAAEQSSAAAISAPSPHVMAASQWLSPSRSDSELCSGNERRGRPRRHHLRHKRHVEAAPHAACCCCSNDDDAPNTNHRQSSSCSSRSGPSRDLLERQLGTTRFPASSQLKVAAAATAIAAEQPSACSGHVWPRFSDTPLGPVSVEELGALVEGGGSSRVPIMSAVGSMKQPAAQRGAEPARRFCSGCSQDWSSVGQEGSCAPLLAGTREVPDFGESSSPARGRQRQRGACAARSMPAAKAASCSSEYSKMLGSYGELYEMMKNGHFSSDTRRHDVHDEDMVVPRAWPVKIGATSEQKGGRKGQSTLPARRVTFDERVRVVYYKP